jgi:hypothetical protein
MTFFRPKDFDKVSGAMLLVLEGRNLTTVQRKALVELARAARQDKDVPWGAPKKIVADLLSIINNRRTRDGREQMDEDALRKAIRSFFANKRKDPLVEEFTDALCNLREARLGVRKVPPLTDDFKKIA